jgi:PAS domain S-box-containing protein
VAQEGKLRKRRVLSALEGDALASGQLEREAFVIQENAQLWRERYRVLFDKNVAGVILTTPEGRIIDCNEACARIFGFESREEMLARSAWDFYFNRSEREILLDRLRTKGSCPREEVCLKSKNGAPIWVLARRTVVSFMNGLPEVLQGTLIDITAQKKAQARPRDLGGQSSASMSEGQIARIADLSQQIGNILRRVSKSLQPDNLSQINRAEMRECFVALEQMKMLMSELEILHIGRE